MPRRRNGPKGHTGGQCLNRAGQRRPMQSDHTSTEGMVAGVLLGTSRQGSQDTGAVQWPPPDPFSQGQRLTDNTEPYWKAPY